MRRSVQAVAVNRIDRHVGERFRQMRLERRIDRGTLAAALGITVATLVAHEFGVLRLGAERLFLACRLLDVAVSRFYENLEI